MPPKALLALAGASAFACALAHPFASSANANSEIARRSWINTLNQDHNAGINYEAVKNNPLTLALFGVADAACLNQAAALALAKSALSAAEARAAVQRFDERYCVLKHLSS